MPFLPGKEPSSGIDNVDSVGKAHAYGYYNCKDAPVLGWTTDLVPERVPFFIQLSIYPLQVSSGCQPRKVFLETAVEGDADASNGLLDQTKKV
jgi:hypothetical protein